MDEYEIKARGKPPQTFRLTGRDGPPGSFQTISGVPAWLARGTPVQCVNAGLHATIAIGGGNEECKGPFARGKPPDVGMRVISTKERYVALKAERNRFPALMSGRLIPLADRFGMTFIRGKPPVARDRGHPPETEYGAFHRVKLPGMGVVCLEQMHEFTKK